MELITSFELNETSLVKILLAACIMDLVVDVPRIIRGLPITYETSKNHITVFLLQ